jgi:hypothetical protein
VVATMLVFFTPSWPTERTRARIFWWSLIAPAESANSISATEPKAEASSSLAARNSAVSSDS